MIGPIIWAGKIRRSPGVASRGVAQAPKSWFRGPPWGPLWATEPENSAIFKPPSAQACARNIAGGPRFDPFRTVSDNVAALFGDVPTQANTTSAGSIDGGHAGANADISALRACRKARIYI